MKILATIEAQRKIWRKASNKYYMKNRTSISQKRKSPEIRLRQNDAGKRYRLKHPERARESTIRWKANNKDRIAKTMRDWRMRTNYGISLDRYKELHFHQNGTCAICGKKETDFCRALAVDHCHNSKKVRGLLCHKCNAGIGNLNDDPALLFAAIEYLVSGDILCV